MVTKLAMDLFNDPFFIGWDTNFAKMQSSASNYPIYDLVKFDNGAYGISLAVAGFQREDINIHVENNNLVIKGELHGETLGWRIYPRRNCQKKFRKVILIRRIYGSC